MRDLVVYAAGGGMRGIFGAGVFHALSGMPARDRALAIYGISAGALNAAHFALGSAMHAMEWYLQYVPEHGTLAHATPVALIRGEDFVDVPEAVRVLLASSSIFPFVHEGVIVNGVSCIDGGYREAVCHARLRREHPNAKLLLVLNDDEHESMVRRMVVGAMLRLRDERLAEVWLETIDHAPAELEEALGDPNTLVIKPEDSFPVQFTTTDPAVLAHGFWLGYRAVLTQRDRVMRFLDG